MLKSFGKVLFALGINLVALGAAAWVGWDTWQRGVFLPDRFAPVEAKAEPMRTASRDTDINQVIRAHLFGREQRQKKQVQKVAPPTRLNLKLVGVLASGGQGGGMALIEISRGKQNVIRVGDLIGKTGARLNQVMNDHVLIERNGKLEKLEINRPSLNALPKPTANQSVNRVSAAARSKPTSRSKPVQENDNANASASAEIGGKKMVLPF